MNPSQRRGEFGWRKLAAVGAASGVLFGCDKYDCSRVEPGPRSVSGSIFHQLEDGTAVESNLAEVDVTGDDGRDAPPVSDGVLRLRWGAEIAPESHALVRVTVPSMTGMGQFGLEELGATVCACPPGSLSSSLWGNDSMCSFPVEGELETIEEPAECSPLVGDLFVHELGTSCRGWVCASRQSLVLSATASGEARFSGTITVAWLDTIDVKTCTKMVPSGVLVADDPAL